MAITWPRIFRRPGLVFSAGVSTFLSVRNDQASRPHASAELGRNSVFCGGPRQSDSSARRAAAFVSALTVTPNLTDSFRVAVTWNAAPTQSFDGGSSYHGRRRQCTVRQRRHC